MRFDIIKNKIIYQAAAGEPAPRAFHPLSILSCSHCVIPSGAVAEQEYHYPQAPVIANLEAIRILSPV